MTLWFHSSIKTTTVYVRSNLAATGSEKVSALLELFPWRARYRYGITNPMYQEGDRIRHYQHIKAKSCQAVEVVYPSETNGLLLGTDCASTQSQGGYADYYTFSVPSYQTVLIDLSWADSFLDTYLYLLRGNSTTGSLIAAPTTTTADSPTPTSPRA